MHMATDRRRLLECAALLQRISVIHESVAVQAMRELRAPPSAVGLLWLLSNDLPEMSMRNLARELSCDPSSVTLQAAALEESGLVERVPDVAGRRRRIPRLTLRGRAAGTALADAVAGASPLTGLDEYQLGTIVDLFQRVWPAR